MSSRAIVERLCQTPDRRDLGVSQSGAAGTPATQTGSPKDEARGSERVKRPTTLRVIRVMVCAFVRSFAVCATQDDRTRSATVTFSGKLRRPPTPRRAAPVRIRARGPDTSWPANRPDKIPGNV